MKIELPRHSYDRVSVLTQRLWLEQHRALDTFWLLLMFLDKTFLVQNVFHILQNERKVAN
uniref:Uncharacterized protein n=1 Tax=Lepeophtheirus salmonis TaxID=72036 RepID=A0A0K2UK21_LEPSM